MLILIKPLRSFALAMMLGLVATCALANSYNDALNAARHGRTQEIVSLLQRGVDPNAIDRQNNSLLILAAREGHPDTVKALLAGGADPSYRNQAGDSALMLATLKGEQKLAEMLLEGGAELDHHDGWNALHYAALSGQLDLLKKFVAHGADVNALAPNGANALMLASRNGHIHIVRFLLATDIDLYQQTDQGQDAVAWALSRRNTDIADLIEQARLAKPRR